MSVNGAASSSFRSGKTSLSSHRQGYHTAASRDGAGTNATGATATSATSAKSATASAGEAAARPYSALMASLFSPPQTSSQTACAEAAASVFANAFSVPAAYDSHFYNHPDVQSVLIHSVASSDKDSGLQAVVVLHPKTSIPPHLGLSSHGGDEVAHLMVSAHNQPFLAYNDAPRALVMAVSVTEYLTLLTFWASEWSRLKSKLLHQMNMMTEGLDPVRITNNLAFYSHGMSHYSVSLSSRLVLRARADSRLSSREEECLKVWLELKPSDKSSESSTLGGGGGGGGGLQVLSLPCKAVTALAQDTHSIKTLTDLVGAYKNRSRKRCKPVA